MNVLREDKKNIFTFRLVLTGATLHNSPSAPELQWLKWRSMGSGRGQGVSGGVSGVSGRGLGGFWNLGKSRRRQGGVWGGLKELWWVSGGGLEGVCEGSTSGGCLVGVWGCLVGIREWYGCV